MARYRSILTGLHALIAVVFGLIANQRAWFEAQDAAYGNLVWLGALLGLFLLFRYAHVFATGLIEKIPGFSPILRRVLAGSSCIEGDWPLIVVAPDSVTGRTRLTYLGFLNVTYRDGQLKVTGRDWYPDGRHAHDFESQQSRLDGNRLQYWYHQGEGSRMRGYTEIYFFPDDAVPERHAGEFLDKEHNSARFYARKLKSRRRLRSDAERLAAARAFWESLEPHIDTVANRPVSADWE